MHPIEIGYRMTDVLKRKSARGRLEGWERFARSSEDSALVLPGVRQALIEGATPELRENLARTCSNILDGRYFALGVDWPKRSPADLFPSGVWRLDPVSGQSWPGPERYCFDISYRHERKLGDIKYVWEFNRLQFLQPLAAYHALTGDRRSVAAIEIALESWFEANPPFRGVAWVSGIELALRAISLLIVTSLCATSLGDATLRRICTILGAHALWLRRFPSRFSSANNHLVAEAAGEFLIGIAMAGSSQAALLEQEGRRVLEIESCRQILSDGVPSEQSPTYGAFVAEFLLLCQLVARNVGRPLSENVSERLRAFADFIDWIADGNGQVPSIGDDDEGRVLVTCMHEANYAASVMACIREMPAGLSHDHGLNFRNCVFSSLQVPAAPVATGAGLRTFEHGGYSVVRDDRANRKFSLVVDHGPLGYLSLAAHGHADSLAFTLSVDGQAVFVDAGTYLYHSGGRWRDWFRGTRAHNTLCLDNVDQSIISGPFNWAHKAKTRLDEVQPLPNWSIRASHDGYVGRFGVRHERTIAATDTGVRIVDRLLGASPTALPSVSFLVSPDCNVALVDRSVIVSAKDVPILSLHAENDVGLEVEVGGTEGGWVSLRFGSKSPAPLIIWRALRPNDHIAFRLEFM